VVVFRLLWPLLAFNISLFSEVYPLAIFSMKISYSRACLKKMFCGQVLKILSLWPEAYIIKHKLLPIGNMLDICIDGNLVPQ